MALTEKLSAIGDAIRSKTGKNDLLTLDEMPQEIQSIETGGGGGGGDTSLADSILDGSIESYSSDSLTSLKDGAFFYCQNLKQVNLPNLETMDTEALGWTSLVEVDFPKLTKVSVSAFVGDASLKKARFGAVQTILVNAFMNTELSTLILAGTSVATLSSLLAFKSTPIEEGTGYIYVPAALLEQYKVATNWVTFADKFRAIEDYPEICGDA